MQVLKQVAKTHKVTINDVVLALTSVSLKEYLRQHNDLETKSLNLLVPFSLREIPRSSEEHRMRNEFSILCFTLGLYSTFEDAVRAVTKTTTSMKNSIYPFATHTLSEFTAWMPNLVGQLILMWYVSKATVVFSNVPGPRVPLNFNGKKSKGLIALIPGNGDLAFGISAISHGETLIMAIQSDVCYLENPSEVSALIEKNYEELKLQQ